MLNENRYLKIYEGQCYKKKYQKRYQKIIVFDLDETIGSFGDLYILWSGLQKIYTFDKENVQREFNSIMDLYPEFLRYGFMQILEFLYTKKKQGDCDKIFIYTNNNCTPPWVSLIIEYIHTKLNTLDPLFDKIISAFKINNKIIEVSRTKKEKSCSDLIRCTMLPKNTEICFIDDTYHKDMLHEKVFYIQPYPYHHGVSVETIIQRFQLSKYGIEIIGKSNMVGKFYEYIKDWFYFHNQVNFENKANLQNEINVFVAQKMMYHIKEFFYLTNRKNRTRKRYSRFSKTTRKNYAFVHT
jgi:hypothetical protein